jgi:hypothetical protein
MHVTYVEKGQPVFEMVKISYSVENEQMVQSMPTQNGIFHFVQDQHALLICIVARETNILNSSIAYE